MDNDREFLAAAGDNDALAANLLIRLSRSETHTPRRQLLESSKPAPPAETEGALAAPQPALLLLPPTRTWGRRRARSAPVAAEGEPTAKSEEEEAGRASPATPLSWSGASGTSGSGSEDGWSARTTRPPKQRRRRAARELGEPGQPPQPASKQRAEGRHGRGEQIGAPPAKGAEPELWQKGGPAWIPAPKWAKVGSSDEDGEPHGGTLVGATATVGSPAGPGSSQATVAAAAAAAAAAATRCPEPPKSVVNGEPLRWRWTRGGGTKSVVFGRQGKKKTVLELRITKEALLREQVELEKELGKQREIYGALLEENMALKKLESSLPSLTASNQAAKSEEPQQKQSASEWQALKGIGNTAYVLFEDSPEQHGRTSLPSPAPVRTFLFDLNCLPDGDL